VKARIALFVLLLLALPLSGFSQSTLNFPRLYTPSELGLSGFAAVNPSGTAATATFTLYSATGVTLATSAQSIPARGQLSKLGTEIFANPSAAGWIQATSTTTGLTGFWLGGNLSTYMDGAEAAAPGQELVFPLATGTTELNIANLATSSNDITIRVYDATGTTLPLASSTVSATIATKGIYQATLASIFPGVNFTNAMYVKVTGTGVITGTTVAVNFTYTPSWAVINGIESTSTTTEANFAHALTGPETGGPKWQSILGVTNLSGANNAVTITYNPTSGSPTSVTRNLNPRGAFRETIKDMFNFTGAQVDGWVKVSGTAPIAGMLALGYSGGNSVAVVPMQQTPQTQYLFAHVAQANGWGSGIAMLNTTSTAAIVEVYIMQPSGSLAGGAADQLTATINLAAGTQVTKLLNEFVPAANFNSGFVYLKSVNNVPLYAYELFFTSDLAELSNVAAGTVDPSITFTPPAPSGGITALTPLTITSLSPASIARGATLTITGLGFSPTAASNTVYFTTATTTTSVVASTATATSLTVVVPSTAISGPVYVGVGSRVTNSSVLQVSATSTTLATPASVTVSASHATTADIYVATPTTGFNVDGFDVIPVNSGSASLSLEPKSASTSSTRWLVIQGSGISSATSVVVSISGSGVTVAEAGASFGAAYRLVQLTIAAGAATGGRNIIITDANLNTSIITGGLIIQ
jgi:hypothetical protein